MISQPLTAGQLRVQQLASQFLQEQQIDPQTLWERDPQGAEAYALFLARLAQDPTICGDALLAGRIVDSEVAVLYLKWLAATNRGELDANRVPIVFDFQRMIFNGSCFDYGMGEPEYKCKVYEGCTTRTTVTPRAVLTLANNGVVYGKEMNLHYYANSRITYIVNGSHRLLACKVLGISTLKDFTVNPACCTIYDDQPNEPLNRALLYFERMYAGDSYRKKAPPIQHVIGYEALWLKLAATYEHITDPNKRNELYLYTKYSLNKRAVLMPPPTLLDDYVTVYKYLNLTTPPVSGIVRFLRLVGLASTPAASITLNESQLAILADWKNWRTAEAAPLQDTLSPTQNS